MTTETTTTDTMTQDTTAPEVIATCHHCEAIITADDQHHETEDGDAVCQSCIDADRFLIDTDGNAVDADHAVICQCNDETYHENDRRIRLAIGHNGPDYYLTYNTTHHDGEWYEDEYFRENFASCDHCGETFSNDDLRYHEDRDGYVCDSCHDELEEEAEPETIKEYNANVLNFLSAVPLDKRTEPLAYTIGVELEIEADRSHADRLHQHWESDAIFKHDGSLDDGWEIVTRPAPYSHHLNSIWTADRLQTLKNIDARSFNTDTCGLHVHIGRATLSQLQIARASVFINNPDNAAFIKAIAQRDPSRWARQYDKTYAKTEIENGERYSALNLNNRATVEFRIFKGTLARAGIVRAIQFCLAVLESNRTGNPNALPLQDAHRLPAFLAYVMKHRALFPDLAFWLDSKGWTKDNAPAADKMPAQSFQPIIKGRESRATRERKAEERRRAALARMAETITAERAAAVNVAEHGAVFEQGEHYANAMRSMRQVEQHYSGYTNQWRPVARYYTDQHPEGGTSRVMTLADDGDVYISDYGWSPAANVIPLPFNQQDDRARQGISAFCIVGFFHAMGCQVADGERDTGRATARLVDYPDAGQPTLTHREHQSEQHRAGLAENVTDGDNIAARCPNTNEPIYKVGTQVYMDPACLVRERHRYMGGTSNPVGLRGTITHLSLGRLESGSRFVYGVEWSNGRTNEYQIGDLLLASDNG